MADAAPQAPDIQAPLPLPAPPAPQAPKQSKQPKPQHQQGQQIIQVNWSHVKPEFSGKLEEDAEAHLLQTNDRINAHHFLEGIKVNRFCLTMVGNDRLWHESLEHININWQGFKNLLRQQYSKIGNTREQLFHAWRPFHFDENTETIDAYVTCIRQVATI